MAVTTRSARRAEYPLVRTLLAQAFPSKQPDKESDEALLWDYLVAHDPTLTPEAVRLALNPEGEPVACTVVLPRTMQGPRGPVPGAIITLVACRPDLQGQGYGGASVLDGLAHMAQESLAFGILYGHARYYPRFGFVPVLPQVRTLLPAAGEAAGATGLRQATPADLPALAALFERHLASYPGAVARGPEPWLWHLRMPATSALLMLAEGGPAYALVSENRANDLLYVHEGAADTPADARRLLEGLSREAAQRSLKEVQLATPPGHLLTRIAVLQDAEQRRHPARYGMVAVTRWEPLLPAGFTVCPGGLCHEGSLVLEAPEARLVQLAFGYRTVDDLLLTGEARLTGEPERLRSAFPSRFPKWSLDPFWDC